MIVFISCVSKKLDEPAIAMDMYRSDLFKKALRYAEGLHPRKIYILSASYGVLELDDYIKPYNLTLNKMNKAQRKKWAYKVYQQLAAKGVNFNERAVFLCGKNYREYLMQKFSDAVVPCEGLGIGQQLSFYNKAETKNKGL